MKVVQSLLFSDLILHKTAAYRRNSLDSEKIFHDFSLVEKLNRWFQDQLIEASSVQSKQLITRTYYV